MAARLLRRISSALAQRKMSGFYISRVGHMQIAPRFVDILLGDFGSKQGKMSMNRFTDRFKRDAAAQVG